VLVVEDNAELRSALAEFLEFQGYHVREAADGREALDLLTYEVPEPCTVLLDLMLPVMNGWQLLSALERSKVHSHSSFVVISGMAESAPKGVPSIRKPFRPADLLRMMSPRTA
jgi:CheY-like chemotaxis protein